MEGLKLVQRCALALVCWAHPAWLGLNLECRRGHAGPGRPATCKLLVSFCHPNQVELAFQTRTRARLRT